MSELRPIFDNRNFSAKILLPNVNFAVERLSRRAIGGPFRATIKAEGEREQLARFLDGLREEVQIFDDGGQLAWWGLVYDFELSTKKSEVQLHCRGWWDTLDWRSYLNTATSNVETTTQVSAIATAIGEFITGVDIETASGISTSQYRDGDRTGMAEIEELLASGTSNNRRLLAEISALRRMRIYEEPQPGNTDPVLEGDVEIGAAMDTMVNKAWAWWTAPGGGERHNTATATDAESAAEYGTKSQALTLSAGNETQANAFRDAELARRKFPIPTVNIDGNSGRVFTCPGRVEIPGYLLEAGIWLRLGDVMPSGANTAYLADVSRIFVEEIEWSQSGGVKITPRDVPGRYGEGA